MPEVRIYETEDGVSPFERWFDELPGAAAAKVRAALARLAAGNAGNAGDSKGVGEGVMERRLTFGPGLRIYYGRDGETLVVLLIGGTKKRQARDVAAAKLLWTDYRRRRDGGERPLRTADEEEEPDDEPNIPDPDEEN